MKIVRPWRCRRCGYPLPGPYRNCRHYADAVARRCADLLTPAQADDVKLMRLQCCLRKRRRQGRRRS